ncbi:MAG: bifunctional diaminohydroxyphosphoribosylaminopyrimidine deaminase/5-amino-6-(5-phosphoribosylamino)uracil reductase RibD [Helicobacter sp.]|nr:bifunctional diaminohydroxyphosphoribosylaminopyrimidine deaminase/5-amino-6-(5-phosphoribosylamino)uracil reductase RibD [Helicobacter sp.]
MSQKSDELFMSLALKEAWSKALLALPNPTVSALVLSKNGEILSIQTHSLAGSAHAEVLALKEAFKKLKKTDAKESQKLDSMSPIELYNFLLNNHDGIFNTTQIFITLEPCTKMGKTPPCANLLQHIKPSRIIFGAKDSSHNGSGGQMLRNCGLNVTESVLEKECLDLIIPFNCLQKYGSFNLFKLAMRLNGDYKSRNISSKEAQIYIHNLRQISNNIIISGKTLESDNPLLDARFATPPYKNTALPDIKILSKRLTIDDLKDKNISANSRNINLYSEIPNLRSFSGFNIIEGGFNLLCELRNQLDMIMIQIAPNALNSAHSELKSSLHFRQLSSTNHDETIFIWLC